jgi:hypothetical protein
MRCRWLEHFPAKRSWFAVKKMRALTVSAAMAPAAGTARRLPDFLNSGNPERQQRKAAPTGVVHRYFGHRATGGSQTTETPADGHAKVKLEPAFLQNQWRAATLSCANVQQGRSLMSNQNQQNQNPGQKPGQQQQGGGQKPGQQQQDPSRKGQPQQPQHGQQDQDR